MFIFCLTAQNMMAQRGKLFNSDNQLSSNLATQVFQDSNGFIWIATRNGIEYKYAVNGQNLKIYVDKELCAPVIDALLPVLPTLDAVLEQLAQSHDPEDIKTLQTIKEIMDQIGLQKPSDLDLVWKATTEFEIAYNFAKA